MSQSLDTRLARCGENCSLLRLDLLAPIKHPFETRARGANFLAVPDALQLQEADPEIGLVGRHALVGPAGQGVQAGEAARRNHPRDHVRALLDDRLERDRPVALTGLSAMDRSSSHTRLMSFAT